MSRIFSNEIVFRGHPDKVCDQISDALLDAFRWADPNSRCGIETAGGKGKIFVTGEVRSSARPKVDMIVYEVLRSCGYPGDYEVINNLGLQSPDISRGVDTGGAGDNGMMFGYACSDTASYLPKAQRILQEFAVTYDYIRRQDFRFLPDGKAQITGEYDDQFNLRRIKAFTICYQNTELEREDTDEVLRNLAADLSHIYGVEIERFLINPTGRFEIGGFAGDAGLTGRKIVVDSYHAFAPVGGGAFSGKDPTKVDRSGAYKARQLAIRCLKKHKLQRCTVQLSYSIGVASPMAIYIDSDIGQLEASTYDYIACEPQNIIADLRLGDRLFEETARFGHFGDASFPWEA